MAKRKNKEHLAHFNIAGFTYYDGAEAFPELSIGTKLKLVPDPENGYDPHAVMIFYKEFKLGYIPKSDNEIFYKLLKTGVDNIIVRIQKLNGQEHPEQQIWAVAHLVRK